MPLTDYAHWNEDAERVWWEEEGRHVEEPPDPDDWEDGYNLHADDYHPHPDGCIDSGDFNGVRGQQTSDGRDLWVCSWEGCDGRDVFVQDEDGTFCTYTGPVVNTK